MTISANVPRVTFACNGVTVDFPFPYPVLKDTDLLVIETVIATGVQSTKTLTADYTLIGTLSGSGHYLSGVTVRANAAPPNTVTWTVINDPALTQLVNLTEGGSLPVEEQVEVPFDRVTLIAQRLRDLISRSLRQPDGDAVNIALLPNKVDRASKFCAFDGDGNPIAAAGTSASLGPVSGYINSLLDDANAAAARATLGFPAISGKGTLLAGDAADSLVEVAAAVLAGQALVHDPSVSGGMRWATIQQMNPIVNGNADVWQRGTSFPNPGSNTFTADMWKWFQSGTGGVTVNRSTDVPSVADAGVLFNYSIEVDVTTADAAIGAADRYDLAIPIEGYDWRTVAQRPFVVSFWVKSPKTGTHAIAFSNGGLDRYFVGTYTVNAANTWERKTVSVPASPSTGTWDYTNNLGARLHFTLAAGSNHEAVPGSWQNGGPFISVAGHVNVMDNAVNFFRLTGVRINAGTVAFPSEVTPFHETVYRCKRYFRKSFRIDLAPAQGAGLSTGEMQAPSPVGASTATNGIPVRFEPPMRATPTTVVTYNPSAANAQVRNVTDGTDCTGTGITGVNENGMIIGFTTPVGTVAGELMAVHYTAESPL